MREIKFRLIKDSNIVGYERHILRDGNVVIQVNQADGDEWYNLDPHNHVQVIHDAKEQLAGYADGEKVYAGDYLEVVIEDSGDGINEPHYPDEYVGGFIILKDGCFGFEDRENGFYGLSILNNNVGTVVGNIHDNPELLEDK